MNKQSTLLSTLAISAAMFSCQAFAGVPPVEALGKPADVYCKPRFSNAGEYSVRQPVLHYDKIIFMISGELKAANPDEQERLDKIPRQTELDIKVKDNPRYVADIKAKVLSFLGAMVSPNYYPAIKIVDVEYTAVVCPK